MKFMQTSFPPLNSRADPDPTTTIQIRNTISLHKSLILRGRLLAPGSVPVASYCQSMWEWGQ